MLCMYGVYTMEVTTAVVYYIRPLQYDDHVQALELIRSEIYRNPEFFGLGSGSIILISDVNALMAFFDRLLKKNEIFGCYACRTDCLVGVDMTYIHFYNDGPMEMSGGSVAVQNYLKYVKFVQRNLWHGCRSTKKVCILISLGIFLKHEIRCNIEFIENMLILREKYARSCKITFIGQAFSGEEIQEMAEKLKYRDLRPSKVEITTQNAEDYDLGHLRDTDMLPIKLLGATLMTHTHTPIIHTHP
ncbi:uncharacterized protein LOC118280423 [Spodoptera frugiperda]|uniref:Uncharacterized protein LOC118280423 n=1 Tax=Spodoptera frugiperda TaxID=7108 RepID=A0A9R0E2C3_SPOFR|nr:uncharacterized protein LOC118280423 [Spodoptera frugiperda]